MVRMSDNTLVRHFYRRLLNSVIALLSIDTYPVFVATQSLNLSDGPTDRHVRVVASILRVKTAVVDNRTR